MIYSCQLSASKTKKLTADGSLIARVAKGLWRPASLVYIRGVILRLFHISRPVLWINTVGPAMVGMWLAGDLWTLGGAAGTALAHAAVQPPDLRRQRRLRPGDRRQEPPQGHPGRGQDRAARGAPYRARRRAHERAVPGLLRPCPARFRALAWMVLYALLFVGYSVPPARFKARPYLDSLSNAAYAFPLVFVPLALGRGPVWPAAMGLMAWSAAKHTFDAVQDVDEDRKVGIETTAVRLGPGRGRPLERGLWALATVVLRARERPRRARERRDRRYARSTRCTRTRRRETGHRLYRYSIAFPYVAGTVAGRAARRGAVAGSCTRERAW